MRYEFHDSSALELAELIQGALVSVQQDSAHVLQFYSQETKSAVDARTTSLSKLESVLHACLLGMIFVGQHLTDPEWWDRSMGTAPDDEHLEGYVSRYTEFTKIGLIQATFSSIESSIRLVLRSLSPDTYKRLRVDFRHICYYLIDEFMRDERQHYRAVTDIMRLIRNTVHNNGVFSPKSGRDVRIWYRDQIYAFEAEKVVNFADWQLLLQIIVDFSEFISRVMTQPVITELEHIEDPMISQLVSNGLTEDSTPDDSAGQTTEDSTPDDSAGGPSNTPTS
ncbi:MAG: hypothetical protein LC641_02450 [Spirochaeta sp.]|nr:hypothetical protein [Spirochaeta sp.]